MSLLSGLLDHMPPTIAGDDKPTVTKPTTERTRLVMVERPPSIAGKHLHQCRQCNARVAQSP